MYSAVEKWRAYVNAYRTNPRDYTAQDGYMVEALEELLAEIDLREEEIKTLDEYIDYLNRLDTD